ncbi:hypothetical protein ACHAPA_012103 [Fusarium lateritium]
MNKLFAGGKSSVIEMVESLIASEWFKPQGDEFWVTAGLTFKNGPEQIKGDTVITLGGYHPVYKPPMQYPDPPRLDISWSLGLLSTTGSDYFAITPKGAMAGVQLYASLSIGVLHAFLDA